jgi:hypothetical protein
MANIEYKYPKTPAGYQALPVGSTAVKLTVPTGTRYATVKVMTNDIRYRDDGPTAVNNTTGGISVAKGTVMELHSREQIDGFKAISTGATGMLEIAYYKL